MGFTIDNENLGETFEKVKQLYQRRYTVTLIPTDENIWRALEIYKFGVENHLTLINAIGLWYGYRYRRMENFMRELQLWRTNKGWLHREILVKIYGRYDHEAEKPFDAELTFLFLIPEFYLNNENNEELCKELFYDFAEYVGAYMCYAVNIENIGIEKKDWDYTYCCTQITEGEFVAWRHNYIIGKWYADIEIANYVIKLDAKICKDAIYYSFRGMKE